MTKIKLCGLSRACDILWANKLLPDYIGFVFAAGSRRRVTYSQAAELRRQLDSKITPVGVFVDQTPDEIKKLVNDGIISAVQLHGHESAEYVKHIKDKLHCVVIQAFTVKNESDIENAQNSVADYVLLDSGAGSGSLFEHKLINGMKRDFFLAGGLNGANVRQAVDKVHPFAVDASTGLETDGFKDYGKMSAFVTAVRQKEINND